MSMEIIKGWAATDAWNDLLTIFEEKIGQAHDRAWAVARSGNAQYEIGKTDGLAISHDLLTKLRSTDG